jgi:hypothetical protein
MLFELIPENNSKAMASLNNMVFDLLFMLSSC